ncbi:sugar transferase [Gordonia insulae]|uniref:UDP-glucose:undecaprenyl-phosphate glucose-1-phosphate transferase n=1 Tax=Gordonia insulae TaxID=2420509 RepID=A0A3G8JVD5_9ACTN|nr:sugar transferase [Gordonia insulae]AZG48130.1 UDP-glucose:undecaprenyl-phosphate glucose-1-phosphate transferase [Gordonia insulae]
MVSTPVRRGGRRWAPVVARNRTDVILVGLDAVVLVLIAVLANGDEGTRGRLIGIAGVVVTLVALDMAGLYRARLTLSALDDLPRLAGWSVITSGVLFTVARPGVHITRAAVYAGLVFLALFAVRLMYFAFARHRRRTSSKYRMPTAVLGGGLVAVELIESTRSRPELGLDIVLAVSDDPMPELSGAGVPIEGNIAEIRSKVKAHGISTLLVAFSSTPDSRLVAPLRECDELDCEIFIVPRLFEFVSLTGDMDRIHTIPLVRMRRDALRTWYWKVKRVFDVTVVSISLILLSPVLATVAAAVYLSDPSAPIIFRQQRIGRGGRLFDVLKFRSMRPVPEQASDHEWQPSAEDRIGTLGRFIRKTSLDELPQLWNVLRGDMSIVGPRPERPHFVEQFEHSIPAYRDRHRVEVGLTGWAAIHGLRGDTSITDRALYDNFYIENWSVWLDIKIIIRTLGAVLRGTGS